MEDEEDENRFSFKNLLRGIFGLNNDNSNRSNNPKINENTQSAIEASSVASEKIGEAAHDIGKAAVENTAAVTDATSDASDVAAVAGIVAIPFTGGSSLTITGYSLFSGTYANYTSTLAKGTDALLFGGSKDAAIDQAIETGIEQLGGKIVTSTAGKLVTRNSPAVKNTLYRSPSTGRFVTNNYGNLVVGTSAAVSVVLKRYQFPTLPRRPIVFPGSAPGAPTSPARYPPAEPGRFSVWSLHFGGDPKYLLIKLTLFIKLIVVEAEKWI
jgi:hypothetical protein